MRPLLRWLALSLLPGRIPTHEGKPLGAAEDTHVGATGPQTTLVIQHLVDEFVRDERLTMARALAPWMSATTSAAAG